jgi:NAD(P)-dependent dehydrogenase (short-subunit alcohol dehydrogenase family)
VSYDFRGKVALVTGAGGRRGIGRATALRLARDGADLALLDIPWPIDQRAVDERDGWNGAASVAAEVEALGRRALVLEADVSDEAQVEAAVAEALARFGRIDILVANAAARPGGDRVPVVELPHDDLARVIGVNLIGTFHCCKAVGRHMASRGQGGAVVIVSSQSGRIGKPRMAAYAASKFGQIGRRRRSRTKWLPSRSASMRSVPARWTPPGSIGRRRPPPPAPPPMRRAPHFSPHKRGPCRSGASAPRRT